MGKLATWFLVLLCATLAGQNRTGTITIYPNGDEVENAASLTDTFDLCGGWTAVGRVENGLKEGWWEIKRNGYTTYSGTYRNGKKEGEWRSNDPSAKFNYKNNLLNGEVVYYHQYSTIVEEKRYYQGGKAHGDWLVFDEEGKVTEIRHFVNDVPEGLWEIQQGYLTWKGSVNEFGYHGKWVVTSHDTLIGGGTYINGKEEGEWIEVHDKFQYSKGNFKSGKKEGRWKSYFNKELVSSREYLHGERNGTDTSWQQGRIISICHFKNDEYSGSCIWYHVNGKKREEYFHDESTGRTSLKEFDQEGNLISNGTLSTNPGYLLAQSSQKRACRVPVPWQYELELREIGLCFWICHEYSHDKPTVSIDSVIHYLRSPLLSQDTARLYTPSGTYRYLRTGVWTFYYPNSKKKEEGEYLPIAWAHHLSGEPTYTKTGWWKVYDERGKLVREELYENGVLVKTTDRKK